MNIKLQNLIRRIISLYSKYTDTEWLHREHFHVDSFPVETLGSGLDVDILLSNV